MTNRQLQALETEKRIHAAAIALFQKKNLEDVTIAEICQAAKVSVGNFYHYYKNKEAVLVEEVRRFDNYILNDFSQEPEQNIEAVQALKALFFLGLSWPSRRGAKVAAQLLQLQLRGIPDVDEAMFGRGRPYYVVLCQLVEKARCAGTVHASYTAEEIAACIWRHSRGILFDWASRQGTFDIMQVAEEDFETLLRGFRLPKGTACA